MRILNLLPKLLILFLGLLGFCGHASAEKPQIFKVDRTTLERYIPWTNCNAGFYRKSAEAVVEKESVLNSYTMFRRPGKLALVGESGVAYAQKIWHESRCRTIEKETVCKKVLLAEWGSRFGKLCFGEPPEIGTPFFMATGFGEEVEWLDELPSAFVRNLAVDFKTTDLLLPHNSRLVEGTYAEDKLWIKVAIGEQELGIQYPNLCSAETKGPFTHIGCHNTDFLAVEDTPLIQDNLISFVGRFRHLDVIYHVLELNPGADRDYALLWKENAEWFVSRTPVSWFDERVTYLED